MNRDTKELTTQRIRGDRLHNALLIRSYQSYPIKPKLIEIDLQEKSSDCNDSGRADRQG
jgi:hypothetical protein